MLKHLARRLCTLFVLVAALAALSSGPVERKAAATTPNRRAAPDPSSTHVYYCMQTLDPWGNCVMVCCNETSCVEYGCTV